MKKLLIDYLLYGLFFGLMTIFAWGRRRHASPLLFAGILLFWTSFFIQIVGMVILYYIFPQFAYEWILFTITIGGMGTSVVMMAHSYLAGNETDRDK